MGFHDDEDVTDVQSLKLLPSLEEVRQVVAEIPGVTVTYYNPHADIREPWLWLDGPAGVVRLYDQALVDQLQNRILEALEDGEFEELETHECMPLFDTSGYIVCPRCAHALPRMAPPIGKTICTKCYVNDRKVSTMIWDGDTAPINMLRGQP